MPRAETVTSDLLRAWPLPEPEESADKAGRGEVHVVGGTAATPGAVLLAGLAALRAGAGKLRITTVPEVQVPLAVAVPEALVSERLASGAQAYVVGPGVLEPHGVVDGVLEVLDGAALVVDALCLQDLPAALPDSTVVTPNVRELEALGASAVDVARDRGVIVLTQGCVAAPDGHVWRDVTGSPALGTSGSGDVLAGLVGGLLARGAGPAQAAVWAQHVHAAAAARLPFGLLARELLPEVPRVLADLR